MFESLVMSRLLLVTTSLAILLTVGGCGEQPAAPEKSDASAADSTATGTVADDTPTSTPDTADEPATASTPSDVSPEDVMRRVADFYKATQQVQVIEENTMQMQMQGMNNNMTSERTMVADKPSRFALRSDTEMMKFDVVSDGETLFTSIDQLKTYTEEEAPESLDELAANPLFTVMGSSGGVFGMHLVADDPYGKMMQGVTEAKYIGRETLDGAAVDHLSFSQENLDWEIWIAAEGDPLVHKVSIDMAKTLAMSGQFEGQDMKMVAISRYRDWKINQPVDEAAFTFTPPEGSEKSDSLFGGFQMEEEPSPLLGLEAPPLELDLLDGSQMNLADHVGRDVVMLDFWATWCGPCVQEMPELAEVAADYKDKGFVFYAVNAQEEPADISEFLKERELDITVALDPEAEASTSYAVQAYPTLLLIGKDGTVQTVHVGYDPNIKAILHEEIDSLLAGENLAAEAMKEREAAEQAAAHPEGLTQAWTHESTCEAVTVAGPGNAIYALGSDSTCTVLNSAGEEQHQINIEGSVSQLRPANLTPSDEPELLGFDAWGTEVSAIGPDGTTLWTEAGGQGVNDVWAADLDGNGLDEVIVGYNGGTGLHVFSNTGVRQWEYTKIANVWHVTAGDVTGDGNTEVVTTSAAGQVHLFDAVGESLANLDCSIYANMVRVGKVNPDDPADTIFVVGTGENGEQLIAMDSDGNELWTIELPHDSSHCDSMAIAPNAPWAAMGMRGGTVNVVDLAAGKIIATAVKHGQTPQVAWAPTDDAPLLLIATGRALKAWHVTPEVTAEEATASDSAGTTAAEAPVAVEIDGEGPAPTEAPELDGATDEPESAVAEEAATDAPE